MQLAVTDLNETKCGEPFSNPARAAHDLKTALCDYHTLATQNHIIQFLYIRELLGKYMSNASLYEYSIERKRHNLDDALSHTKLLLDIHSFNRLPHLVPR